jgi:hypothetical protein
MYPQYNNKVIKNKKIEKRKIKKEISLEIFFLDAKINFKKQLPLPKLLI